MNIPPLVTSFIRTTLPKMEGWCTEPKAVSMAARVLAEKPQLCVEIGVFGGRSLCAMAIALRELGQGKAIGIDPWAVSASLEGYSTEDPNGLWWSHNIDHEAIYRGCLDWLSTLSLTDNVEILRMTNREALPYVQSLPSIDMLHIDGNHSEATSMFDVENYVPLCSPGAIVWFDDTDWASTKTAQRRLEDFCTFEVLIGTCGMYRKR
jgi:hypothetical protein